MIKIFPKNSANKCVICLEYTIEKNCCVQCNICILCKECKDKVDICPCCRKQYFKKYRCDLSNFCILIKKSFYTIFFIIISSFLVGSIVRYCLGKPPFTMEDNLYSIVLGLFLIALWCVCLFCYGLLNECVNYSFI